MDDQIPDNSTSGQDHVAAAAEPVRSRWIPKPEQILILESIFNSGMVNPPKEETVRIRKVLEKFGPVGDANVFYWFQNRRSRSRRRQRQMQASLAATDTRVLAGAHQLAGGAPMYELATSSSSSSSNSSGSGFIPSSSTTSPSSSSSLIGDDGTAAANDLFSISRRMGLMENTHNPFMCSSEVSQLHYQTGTVTVFINGIPSEVPRGPIDVRAMFGQDVMLMHSSGEVISVNEYGFLLQSLQMGESYFLVSRPS